MRPSWLMVTCVNAPTARERVQPLTACAVQPVRERAPVELSRAKLTSTAPPSPPAAFAPPA